jgi:hypothetical protein
MIFWKNEYWIDLVYTHLNFTYRTIRWCLNRQQSNVNVSNSPPSPQTLIPYFSAYKKKKTNERFIKQNNNVSIHNKL